MLFETELGVRRGWDCSYKSDIPFNYIIYKSLFVSLYITYIKSEVF